MNSRKQSGFTLVEMAIVLLIAATLMAGTIAMLGPYIQTIQRNSTRTKLENISQTLALFAQNYGRLPCPGDPKLTDIAQPFLGSPYNSGPDGSQIAVNAGCGSASATRYKGIVPFRALGLDEDQVRDSYGNFITYAVTRAMTLHNSTSLYNPADIQERVHEACRIRDIWVPTNPVSNNLNVAKAHICCAPLSGMLTDSDINIFSDGIAPQTIANRLFPRRPADNARYVNPNTPYPVNPPTVSDPPPVPNNRFIAFVLISHGRNGDGAFIGRKSPPDDLRGVTTSAINTQETENRDQALDNLDFVSRGISTSNDANYFDDILVWKTNDQLISSSGRDSCARP